MTMQVANSSGILSMDLRGSSLIVSRVMYSSSRNSAVGMIKDGERAASVHNKNQVDMCTFLVHQVCLLRSSRNQIEKLF